MFSILICTRNSSRILEEVISSIFNQSRIDLLDEVILVDNKSTDETVSIFVNSFSISEIKNSVIINDRFGKSMSLIEGFNISKSPYTVILDDDNILQHTYLENAQIILNGDAKIGCLGSMGLIDRPINYYPHWFTKYQHTFAIGLPAQGPVTDWVWGAASIVNMEAWDKLKEKDFIYSLNFERTGHSKPTKFGGEDVETSLAIKLLGYDISFSSTLKFYHKFDTSRLNETYLISNNKGTAASVPILEIYRTFIYKKDILFFGQIVFHIFIVRKILISFWALIKIFFSKPTLLDINMGYSTLLGIISGYVSFFNKIKFVSKKVKKLTN